MTSSSVVRLVTSEELLMAPYCRPALQGEMRHPLMVPALHWL